MIHATCVIYLRLERASGRLVAGRVASRAALRGGARRRGAFGVLQGYGLAKLAQNGPEGMWKLTGVWIGSGMSRRVVVGGVRAAGLAELAEEGPLQRPERGSGLGEDPIVEVEPWCFSDGALVRWRGGIAHRRRRGPFCGGARCRGAVGVPGGGAGL